MIWHAIISKIIGNLTLVAGDVVTQDGGILGLGALALFLTILNYLISLMHDHYCFL